MTDETIINFGKHRGKKIANVPADYLLWVEEQPWCSKGLKKYIEDNKQALEMEIKNNKR